MWRCYRGSSILRSSIIGVTMVFLMVVSVDAQRFEEFVDFEPTGEQFDFDRWPYRLPEAVNARLQELAEQYPGIVRAHHIGNSREGR